MIYQLVKYLIIRFQKYVHQRYLGRPKNVLKWICPYPMLDGSLHIAIQYEYAVETWSLGRGRGGRVRKFWNS